MKGRNPFLSIVNNCLYYLRGKQSVEPVSGDAILPDETWLHVLSFLDKRGLAKAKMVSGRFNQLASDYRLNPKDISAVTVSPSGEMAAFACDENKYILVKPIRGGDVTVLRCDNKLDLECYRGCKSLHFTQDGNCLIARYEDTNAFKFVVWDLKTKAIKHVFKRKDFFEWESQLRHLLVIGKFQMLSNDQFFFSVRRSKGVKGFPGESPDISQFFIVDIHTGDIQPKEFKCSSSEIDFENVCVSPDKKQIAFVASKQINLFDFANGERNLSFALYDPMGDGSTIEMKWAEENEIVFCFDVATENSVTKNIANYDIASKTLYGTSIMRKEYVVLDGMEVCVDTNSEFDISKQNASYDIGVSHPNCIFSSDGRRLAFFHDAKIDVYDLETNTTIETYPYHPSYHSYDRCVSGFFFTNEGRFVIFNREDIHIHDLPTIAPEAANEVEAKVNLRPC